MIDIIQTYSAIIYPLVIFLLKCPELCINAIRIILTAKGYKFYAAILIFIEACLGLTALTLVFSKLDNPVNIFAFGLGMASGGYLGIWLEKKIALGVVLVRVITQLPADELLINLRKLGFRVTEVSGESNYGRVGVLFAVVKRNNTTAFIKIVTQYNPNAFYTIEEISHVSQIIIQGGNKKTTPVEIDEDKKGDSKPTTPIEVDEDKKKLSDFKEVLKRGGNSMTKFFPKWF